MRSVGLGVVEHPLLGGVVGLGGGEGFLFTGRVSISDDPWLSDHAVMGTVLLAGTAFLEMVGRAGREVGCLDTRSDARGTISTGRYQSNCGSC